MKRIFTYSLLSLVSILFFSGSLFASKNNVGDVAGLYAGKLTVDLNSTGILTGVYPSPDQILLEKEGVSNETIALTLKDFSFTGLLLGDINLVGIPIVVSNDTTSFTSAPVRLEFIDGAIVADVVADGIIVGEKTFINIEVGWVTDPDDPSLNLPIMVDFVGNIIHDGLRLNDIQLNETSIADFDSEKFGYGTLNITGTETLSSVKADESSQVGIELDGNWMYLHVTDGVRTNTYTLANIGGAQDSIKSINLSSSVSGDLKIWDGAEISGDAIINGNIIYVKPVNGEGWNVIGLPYTPETINAILSDDSKVDITNNIDSYYYGNSQSSGNEVDELKPIKEYFGAMTFKLKSNTDAEFVEFVLPKNSDISLKRSDLHENANNTYPNNSFVSAPISDFAPLSDAVRSAKLTDIVYYIFDGSQFVKSESNTIITPGTPYIMSVDYGVETLAMPDDPSWTVSVKDELTDNINISTTGNVLHVKGYYGKVEVYSVSGLKVTEESVNDEASFELSAGTYIIRTATKATIVIVK